MKNIFSSIFAFFKRNAFSCVCLLLALLVFVTGSVSYSKYVVGGSGGGSANAASFSVSATIDGVSALSFTNTSFWGGSVESDKIAMNALRTLNFSVNNFKTDSVGNKKVSDVKMQYTLTFSAPKNFAEKLAIQPFTAGGSAIMPQIVIADLIAAGNSGNAFNTRLSADYNGTDTTDLTFTVSKNAASTYYFAQSGKYTIIVESFPKVVKQTLLMRSWNTSAVTSEEHPTLDSEAGKLQPPVTVTYSAEVDFYRISIGCTDFTLPAGKEQTAKYSLQLAPTDTIEDGHLGGSFVDVTRDSSGNVTSFTPIKAIYSDGSKTWTVQTTRERLIDNYYADDTFSGSVIKTTTDEYGVMGNPKIYTQGATVTEESSSKSQVHEVTNTGYLPSDVTESYVKGTNTYTNIDEAISWNPVNVTSGAPSFSNYQSAALAVAKRTDSTLGTSFYIHKVTGTQTGTVTVRKSETTKRIIEKTVTDRQTDVVETSFVQSADSSQSNVLLNVTKTTKVIDVGSALVEVVTTVTEATRTVTRTGEFYLGYYEPSSNPGTVAFWGDDVALQVTESKSSGISVGDMLHPRTCINETSRSATDGPSTTISTSTPTQENQSFVLTSEPLTEYYTRALTRKFVYTDLILTDVTWAKRDEHGNAIYDSNGVLQVESFAGESNKLSFFNDKDVQQIYLAQCYSKSYPFFVNVVFQQVL